MRIDSHQHYWKADRGDYHWMSPRVAALCRDYLPSDLAPLLRQHEIDKTILVQAAQTVAETDFLLGLAGDDTSIAGVVGWLNMESPGFPLEFENYRKNPKFIGLRPMLQDLPDDDWILRPKVIEFLRYLAKADFPFEFLTYPRHLPFVLRALDLVPGLRAVVDHISKPPIREHRMEPWRSLMRAVSQRGNVYCKLSGMITEADHTNWSAADLRPYVEHVIDCFGVDRVMFGSDWPVCLLAGTYGRVIDVLHEVLAPVLTETSGRKIFGTNALEFYRLDLELQ